MVGDVYLLCPCRCRKDGGTQRRGRGKEGGIEEQWGAGTRDGKASYLPQLGHSQLGNDTCRKQTSISRPSRPPLFPCSLPSALLILLAQTGRLKGVPNPTIYMATHLLNPPFPQAPLRPSLRPPPVSAPLTPLAQTAQVPSAQDGLRPTPSCTSGARERCTLPCYGTTCELLLYGYDSR